MLISPEGKFRSLVDAAVERMGREPRIAMTLRAIAGLARVVEDSDLVALIRHPLALHLARLPGLDVKSQKVVHPKRG